MSRQFIWRSICILVIVIAILTFTPLVTPVGQVDPFWLGMPYTLWVGILQTLVLLALLIAGSRVHPGLNDTAKTIDDA